MGCEDIYSAKLVFPKLSFDCFLFYSSYDPTINGSDQHYNLILTGGTPDFSSEFQDPIFSFPYPFV